MFAFQKIVTYFKTKSQQKNNECEEKSIDYWYIFSFGYWTIRFNSWCSVLYDFEWKTKRKLQCFLYAFIKIEKIQKPCRRLLVL
jgi:hypothetical protein